MLYIGIDPGKQGGIAMLKADGEIAHAFKMPETLSDLLKAFQAVGGIVDDGTGTSSSTRAKAVLEKVHAGVFGGQKTGRMGVSSAFTFGRGLGNLEMALLAAQIPYDEIPPQRWQKAMDSLTRGDKNVSKRRAQQLFPHFGKITHAIADALLLAEYCRRQDLAERLKVYEGDR